MKSGQQLVLKAKKLSKTYVMGEVTVNALKNVDFEIYEGEFIVVLGPSGSGKSTLLNLIGGMNHIEEGELYYRESAVQGMDKNGLAAYRRNAVGFVFQFYNLIPSLTAYENVALAAEIVKNPFKIEEVLKDVGLEDRAGHFPSQLSGGQQQRVAMARAVVKNPDILLCDEPTGALDSVTGEQVMALLKEINRNYNKTVIVITHDQDIALLADRVFRMSDGGLNEVEKVDIHASA